ncbi:hypothetical protein LTR37_021073 [Vermiconidia calcicola]|uniref:Uncharacterized protein n=1 Tax=Vermiconidia calcicola TaxID=1690605 RepID=A0ACC3M9S3_9PEZI|nr:hypothetical protein LTR37_021073 [Vermiconidia calcicola]
MPAKHTITSAIAVILAFLAVCACADEYGSGVQQYIDTFNNTNQHLIDYTGPYVPEGGENLHIIDTTENVMKKLREHNPNYDTEDWATSNANASRSSNVPIPAPDTVTADIKATGNNVGEFYCTNPDGTGLFGNVPCVAARSIIDKDLPKSGSLKV